jgi:hypothetical protein
MHARCQTSAQPVSQVGKGPVSRGEKKFAKLSPRVDRGSAGVSDSSRNGKADGENGKSEPYSPAEVGAVFGNGPPAAHADRHERRAGNPRKGRVSPSPQVHRQPRSPDSTKINAHFSGRTPLKLTRMGSCANPTARSNLRRRKIRELSAGVVALISRFGFRCRQTGVSSPSRSSSNRDNPPRLGEKA